MPLIVAAAVLLPAPGAQAKPKGCFSKAEMTAEYNIRQGVRLRESANRCEQLGLSKGTAAIWREIEQAIAPQLAAENEKRRKAFDREFEGNAQIQMQLWNGRVVNFFRHRPLTEPYCRNLEASLQQLAQGGWGAFRRLAQTERGEIRVEIRACD